MMAASAVPEATSSRAVAWSVTSVYWKPLAWACSMPAEPDSTAKARSAMLSAVR